MISEFYSGISTDQVLATYSLMRILTRLRVIGLLTARTVETMPATHILGGYDVIDMTMSGYGIEKISYNPSKGHQDAEDVLERLFGRKGDSLRGIP